MKLNGRKTFLSAYIRISNRNPDIEGIPTCERRSVCMADYKTRQPEIKVWEYRKAPKGLRDRVDSRSEWLVLVPASMVSCGIERLIWRWHSDEHPVLEYSFPDGTVLLAGSHPTMSTMMMELIALTAKTQNVRATY